MFCVLYGRATWSRKSDGSKVRLESRPGDRRDAPATQGRRFSAQRYVCFPAAIADRSRLSPNGRRLCGVSWAMFGMLSRRQLQLVLITLTSHKPPADSERNHDFRQNV